MLTPEERRALESVSGERARAVVAELIGPSQRSGYETRLEEKSPGSQAEREGAERVRALLAPLVDECALEPYEAWTAERLPARLEVLSPVSSSLACEVNPYGGSGKGQAELVDGGDGTLAALLDVPGGVTGRVVLVSTSGRPGGDGIRSYLEVNRTFLEAKRLGAVCVVISRAERREDLISVHGVNADIPVLSISSITAHELRALMDEGARPRVAYEALVRCEPARSFNVVGTIRGTRFPEEVIYIGSHHDTWFVGAHDNLCSVAAGLEAARWFQEHPPLRTLRFVVFGGEEGGWPVGEQYLYYDRGSYCYTLQHQAEIAGIGASRAIAILNHENMGYSSKRVLVVTGALLSWAKAIAADLGPDVSVSEAVRPGSDQLPFETLGLPGAYTGRWPQRDDTFYHTPEDNLGTVDTEALAFGARLVLLMALRLDQAVTPLSVPDILAAAQRGTTKLKAAQTLAAAAKDAATWFEGGSDEVRRRRALALARLCSQGIYAFGPEQPLHKFEFAEAANEKLMDAVQRLRAGEDGAAVRETLRQIPGVGMDANYSQEVNDRVASMCLASPIMARLPFVRLDLHEELEALRNGHANDVADRLSSKADSLRAQAEAWAFTLANALQSLTDTPDQYTLA